MNRFRNFWPLVAAVLVGAATLGSPTQAHAGFTLSVTDGTNTANITDNGSGDLDSAAGSIIFSGALGVFNINITVGTSNAPGTPSLAQLTINNTSITTTGFTGSKTLTFTLEDTGFTAPTGSSLSLLSQVSTTQLPSNTNVTYQSFLNNNGGTQLSLNTVGGTSGSDPVNISSSPFTLKSVTAFALTGTGSSETVQFTGLTAVAVPAPAGVVLALTAAPFLGLGCWLRRRQKA